LVFLKLSCSPYDGSGVKKRKVTASKDSTNDAARVALLFSGAFKKRVTTVLLRKAFLENKRAPYVIH
jgi:hypothetical protein